MRHWGDWDAWQPCSKAVYCCGHHRQGNSVPISLCVLCDTMLCTRVRFETLPTLLEATSSGHCTKMPLSYLSCSRLTSPGPPELLGGATDLTCASLCRVQDGGFEKALEGCTGMIHCATPLWIPLSGCNAWASSGAVGARSPKCPCLPCRGAPCPHGPGGGLSSNLSAADAARLQACYDAFHVSVYVHPKACTSAWASLHFAQLAPSTWPWLSPDLPVMPPFLQIAPAVEGTQVRGEHTGHRGDGTGGMVCTPRAAFMRRVCIP